MPGDAHLVTEGEGGVVDLDLDAGRAALWSSRCPGKESPNEDAVLVSPLGRSVVLGLADGCGGHAGGREASRAALEAADRVLRETDQPATSIVRAFDAANEAVQEPRSGAATTLNLVVVTGREARGAHAGDSLILITGQRGRVHLCTVGHAPVAMGVEAGLISERDALGHDDRHLVTNIVGADDMRVEVGPQVTLGTRDTVLLASDGLTDNLTQDEIVETVRKGPLHKAVERLAERALARMNEPGGHPDDLSLLAFRLA